jgi:hypothetical protein
MDVTYKRKEQGGGIDSKESEVEIVLEVTAI